MRRPYYLFFNYLFFNYLNGDVKARRFLARCDVKARNRCDVKARG